MTTDLRLVSDMLSKVLSFFHSAQVALRDGRDEDAAVVLRFAAAICSTDHPYPLHPVMQAADADLARVAEGDVCLPRRGGGEPHHFVSAHHAVWFMCELCWLWGSASTSPFDLRQINLSRLSAQLGRERAKLLRDRVAPRTDNEEPTPWETGEWEPPTSQVGHALELMWWCERGVEKETFADKLWPGKVVGDGTLRQAVNRVKRYLKEQGSDREIGLDNGRIVWVV